MDPRRNRPLLYALFAASGFSGLLYESVWSRYLGLLLGHAATAQTLVLALFMGGMALGAWWCSERSRSWTNLLRTYALVEAAIGVAALLFHPLFVVATSVGYETILPALPAGPAVSTAKWGLAAALILPPSVLLGTTFPLMTGGVLRRGGGSAGSTVALLYFANSLGGAMGVLTSGLWLVEVVGLPGTLWVGGAVNLGVAAVVFFLSRTPEPALQIALAPPSPGWSVHDRLVVGLLAVAALTGTASFAYEIAWIRMLTLVLGASSHAFELMLGAFLLGLAAGGLWVRHRLDRTSRPEGLLAVMQVAMGLAALATLVVYAQSFELMQWLVQNLPQTAGGYRLFLLGSHGIALAVMVPATFCAGTTLPLVTWVLLRRGYGEKTLGAVYAANTVGGIVGVFAAVHLGLVVLGLKGLVVAGAVLDLTLGLALAWWVLPRRMAGGLAALAAAGVLVAAVGVQLRPHDLASGVYRTGRLRTAEQLEVVYHRDGKTASVSVTRQGGGYTLRTNGKPDASLFVDSGDRYTEDEPTMVLAGVLPLLIAPETRRVANIGLGSGQTTHALLASTTVERVDTVEIEPRVAEASQLFWPKVHRAFDDPRSHLFFDDAKSFFPVRGEVYDLVISEPSNPWVSGVDGLFSVEFYRHIRSWIADDGLLVQWLQLYELEPRLVQSVLAALGGSFSDYVVYATNSGDLLIVARPEGTLEAPVPDREWEPGLAASLAAVGIRSSDDLMLRRVGDRALLHPWVQAAAVPPHSDYHPVLGPAAARARFLGATATDLLGSELGVLPLAELLGSAPPPVGDGPVVLDRHVGPTVHLHLARALMTAYRTGEVAWDHEEVPLAGSIWEAAEVVHHALTDCANPPDEGEWFDAMFNSVALRVVPFSPDAALEVLAPLSTADCHRALSPPQRDLVALLQAVARRQPDAMSQTADRLLLRAATLHPGFLDYVLGASVLGHLALGEGEVARDRWQTHGASLSAEVGQGLRWQVLGAHMGR